MLGQWSYHGIFGYSDDNLLLAPSPFALQKMLSICETFACDHNLQFSTDKDPLKCKTKCVAFTRRKKPVPVVKLCGNSLPWVDSFKHLGHTISITVGKVTEQDVTVKRAQYLNKTFELNQEFGFASSRTKLKINNIYNSNFYGSPIWNLYSKSVDNFVNAYNRSMRVLFNLPLQTHRNLLPVVTQQKQIFSTLISRFLGFVDKVRKSHKIVPKLFFNHIKRDVRSTTGKNLRRIMLDLGKDDISEIRKKEVGNIYHNNIKPDKSWRVNILKELLDVRENLVEVDGIEHEEITEIINFICTS